MGYTPIRLVTEVFCVDCCGVTAEEKKFFFFPVGLPYSGAYKP